MDSVIIDVAPGVETALARAIEHHTHFLPGCTLGQIETLPGAVGVELYGAPQDLRKVKAKILLIASENGLGRYVRSK